MMTLDKFIMRLVALRYEHGGGLPIVISGPSPGYYTPTNFYVEEMYWYQYGVDDDEGKKPCVHISCDE